MCRPKGEEGREKGRRVCLGRDRWALQRMPGADGGSVRRVVVAHLPPPLPTIPQSPPRFETTEFFGGSR